MKMCSKVDQTATLSPQDNYFPEVLENCKEICYNVENAKAKWRKPDEEVRIMAVTKTVPPEKVNFAVAQGFKDSSIMSTSMSCGNGQPSLAS